MKNRSIALSDFSRLFAQAQEALIHSRKLQITCAVVFLLMFFLDFGESTRYWQHFSDFLHTPIFLCTVVALWLFLGGALRAQWLSALICLVVASLIELIQPIFGRSESMTDIQNGFLGVFLGVITISLIRLRSRSLTIILLPLLVLLFLLPLGPAWREKTLQNTRRARLPIIADFETESDLAFISPIAEEAPKETYERFANAHSGQFGLRVQTIPFHFSGIELRLESMDWSKSKALVFFAFASEAFPLQIRVDDWGDCTAYNSRFNAAEQLQRGWNRIEIPISAIEGGPARRKLDIAHLRRLLIFREASQSVWTFTLDDLQLTN